MILFVSAIWEQYFLGLNTIPMLDKTKLNQILVKSPFLLSPSFIVQ